MPIPENHENLSDDELIDWLISGPKQRPTAHRTPGATGSVRQASSRRVGHTLSGEGTNDTGGFGKNGQRMRIEQRFNIGLIAALALREKQIQQNYRPIIGVHKWFARRPGSLFRGLILAEFGNRPILETYFCANDFRGITIADPFMGGGTPLVEANRVGCNVQGFDINPMSAWIVREEIEHLDIRDYRRAATDLMGELEREVGELYRTDCPRYGSRNVPVKYFLWVKVIPCEDCGHDIDLFPGYLIADNTRHPQHLLMCGACGELNEVADRRRPGHCRTCRAPLAT